MKTTQRFRGGFEPTVESSEAQQLKTENLKEQENENESRIENSYRRRGAVEW